MPLRGSNGRWNLRISGHMPASTQLWLPPPPDRMLSEAAWQSRWFRRRSLDSSESSDATMANQASPSSGSGSSEGVMSHINEGIHTASLAVREGREPSPMSPVQSASPMWETPVPWVAAETDWPGVPEASTLLFQDVERAASVPPPSVPNRGSRRVGALQYKPHDDQRAQTVTGLVGPACASRIRRKHPVGTARAEEGSAV